jgi:cyclopropane-fatty-acyl-phospholipid synthase
MTSPSQLPPLATEPALATAARPGPAARLLRSGLERRLTELTWGSVTLRERWSGRSVTCGSVSGPSVTMELDSGSVYSALALGGSIGAAEAYADGLWSCAELTDLVRIFVRNRDVLQSMERGLARLTAPLHKLFHALRPNTRSGSRRNIAAHYDLGNDFFARWLDPSMTYSCGLFETPESTLEQAQVAKLDRLCRKLGLRSDMHLLEVGSGWGSMALHAASTYGCRVTTTTISAEQHALATERVAAAGLAERVTVLCQDYRDLRGQYDRVVSVEMIEAVGHRFLDGYMGRLGELAAPDGLVALQAITIADQDFTRAVRDVDVIKKHIFPGSFIPSTTAILDAATRASDLRLVHLEELGPHYAETLQRWHDNVRGEWEPLQALGYDETFLRMWEWYLCYCEGGFAERYLGLQQVLFARPMARQLPLLPELPAP